MKSGIQPVLYQGIEITASGQIGIKLFKTRGAAERSYKKAAKHVMGLKKLINTPIREMK